MKCIMIVDPSLPSELIADTTAALGLSLGIHINGLIWPDIEDRQANTPPIIRTGAGLVDTNHTHRRSKFILRITGTRSLLEGLLTHGSKGFDMRQTLTEPSPITLLFRY